MTPGARPASCWIARSLLAAVCLTSASALIPRQARADPATWKAGVTVLYQRPENGPANDELTASADFLVTWPRRGGVWELHLEGSTSPDASGVSAIYPLVNADAGTAVDRNGNGRVQLSELYYRFQIDSDQALALGIVDVTRWLDTSWIANDENHHFLNGSFVNNPTVAFPDYTAGAVYSRAADGAWPDIVVAATSSAGFADSADRSYQALLDVTEDGDGLFLAAEAGWDAEHRFARVGTWLRSDDNPLLNDPTSTGDNYGLYAVLGGRTGVHEVDVRLGVANDEVSRAARHLALAYQRNIGLGLAGIGWARVWLTDPAGAPGPSHTSFAELFYRWPLGRGAAHLTPSLQFVADPARQEPGGPPLADTLVFGLRFHWSLTP